jgi:hypothetical protein
MASQPLSLLHTLSSVGAGEVTAIATYPPSNVGEVVNKHRARAIQVFCSQIGRRLADLPGLSQHCLATYTDSHEGRPRIVSGSEGGHVTVYDGDSFAVLHQHTEHHRAVLKLVAYFNPNVGRHHIVSGRVCGKFPIIDGDSGELVRSLPSWAQPVSSTVHYV